MRKNKQTKLIIIILLAILIIGSGLYLSNRSSRKVNQSYSVNETATLKPGTSLYKSLRTSHVVKTDARSTVTVNKYYLMTINKEQQTYAQIKFDDKTYYLHAKDLQLSMNNDVNKYIAQLGYPHTRITSQIYNGFPKRGYATATGKPQGVVIHDTGTEYSTLGSEVSYMEKNYQADQVFVHAFIDANEIRNIADSRYMAEGAGPKANPYYLQFEMPHEYSAQSFAKQIGNAAYYTAANLRKNNLPVIMGNKTGTGTIWTHEMVTRYLGGTDHSDPTSYWTKSASKYFCATYTVKDFTLLVQAYYNQL